ncbi:MAG: hypothetical protein K6T88_00215 [Bacillus sp. (in: Bacteria)]|nr:hypothetical protein [Bacillus sp. (in: firmicutes)]
MEKQMTNLSIFEDYRNRQVILNYYQEEDFLWKRDGFHVESIHVSLEYLVFTKSDGSQLTIALNDFSTAAINYDFQNYYVFRKEQERVEIYFP